MMEKTGTEACLVSVYTLRWDGGEQQVTPANPFTIDPGAKVERSAALTQGTHKAPIMEAEAKVRMQTLRAEVQCEAPPR